MAPPRGRGRSLGRRFLGALCFLAACAVPSAHALEAPQLTTTSGVPDPLLPGTEGNATLTVQYCYSSASASASPAAVQVELTPQRTWFTASASPSSFAADTGGQRCGTQAVLVTVTAGRDAPAYQLASLAVRVSAEGTPSGTSSNASIPVQARYASEVRLTKPTLVRVPAGDSGTLTLPVAIGANGGTRIEVTGRDPTGALALQGAIVDTGAGNGLDQTDRRTIPLTVTVSPAASVGMHRLTITVSSHYASSPTDVGEAATVEAEVDVTALAQTRTPGFEAAAAMLAPALVVALRRARRP